MQKRETTYLCPSCLDWLPEMPKKFNAKSVIRSPGDGQQEIPF